MKRECPNRKEKVNALVVIGEPKEEVARLSPLRMINALQVLEGANQGMDGAKPNLKVLLGEGSPRKGLAKGRKGKPPGESRSGPGKRPRSGEH